MSRSLAKNCESAVLDAILVIVVLPSVLLSICFAVEVAAGLRPLSGQGLSGRRTSVSAVVVVPAHNEERSIASTVAALSVESAGVAELLVVADNCTDRTAQITRDSGARCIVRTDPANRGKGYALAFARDELAKSPP